MENNQHNEKLSAMAPVLSAIVKRELHKCPQGYFDGLADEVLSKIKVSPVLNAIEKKDLYEVPEGYFDELSQKVMKSIELAPVLSGLEKKELHVVPEGYFDGFSHTVLKNIEEAPVLLGLEKKELLEAPVGYFEDSATNNRIKQITKKIIPLHIRVWQWTAVAAGICLIVGTTYFIFNDTNSNGSTRVVAQQNATPDDYTNYLMNELQDEELYAFVSENQAEVTDSTDAMMDYLVDESTDFDLENLE